MAKRSVQKVTHPLPLGVYPERSGIRFSFVSKADNCGIILYSKATGRKLKKVPFAEEDRIGNVYYKVVEKPDADSVTYQFYEEDRIIPDERSRVFPGKTTFGKERKTADLKAGIPTELFDWGNDCCPRIPYNQAIGYCMHVRGFTKHSSSNVENKGTFAGIVEKISYLKEIGITTIELQPAYEFTEIDTDEEVLKKFPYNVKLEDVQAFGEKKINYWGYKKGYYYAPKAAYASSEDPVREFKALVKALHENHMELIMQFYFPKEVKNSEILDILRFWVLEYHVDGFHLMGDNILADELALDDILADTKLWYYRFDMDRIYEKNEKPKFLHLAEYNDDWYIDIRKFLKGDENMLCSVMYHMRHIPEKAGCIHYLSNYYGFTIADLVTYDYKHNEENGEDNRDGSDYNCSWNCGVEGSTRKLKINRLRMKQMKNAMCLIMLSQSTPLIFMGDEFGNSQKGNNNPYCQDNAVTWLDWTGIKKNAELFEFWKMLVDFRRNHPILHPEKELRLMDYISCGYPDLSYHGQNAWRPQTESYFRHIGIMLCGKYAKIDEHIEDSSIYIAMNMHWENHELALPNPPKGTRWEMKFSTESESGTNLLPRSIAVYTTVSVSE